MTKQVTYDFIEEFRQESTDKMYYHINNKQINIDDLD